jgi:putative ABC transport system substrate-binding protein
MLGISRREFITLLGGAAAALPLAARAQQGTVPVVGFLHAQSLPVAIADGITGLYRGLAETGYTEGKNLSIDYRWGQAQGDRVVALAGEMARNRHDVIVVVGSTRVTLALKAATQTIPVVFMIGSDPVATGLVTRGLSEY